MDWRVFDEPFCDVRTLIGLVSLAILFRWKVSNTLLIAATSALGLIAFPLLQPTWVMVH
jgi:chromate transporter